MLINENSVVTMVYKLSSIGEDQQVVLLEERSVDDPLEFIFGRGVLLPKVEEKIAGQGFGFQAQVDLHPRDAFGPHQPSLVTWMPKFHFPSDLELSLGMKFQTQGPGGDVISVIVKDIKEDQVMIDGNHPLAGLELRFEIRVLRVREATPEELQTGEVNVTNMH